MKVKCQLHVFQRFLMVVGLFMHVLANSLFNLIFKSVDYEDDKVMVTIFVGQVEIYKPCNWTLMKFF